MSYAIYKYVSPVDKVIKFISDELDIEITERHKELIMDKIYPNIKNKINWFFEIDDEEYEGMITKQEYEIVQKLSPETDIYFNGWSKEGYYCKLLVKFRYQQKKFPSILQVCPTPDLHVLVCPTSMY